MSAPGVADDDTRPQPVSLPPILRLEEGRREELPYLREANCGYIHT